ncbi:MAG: zinc ribbon domain-containing protein [Tropicimonas sp.]|uniref:zinc ribbon domain-containing protein n=1 Tax=Tropicimonas sp. TaxID=2067044 RepID=UPI003A8A0EF2
MAVPPLIEREIFDAVQTRLKSRNPMVTPARVSSGPTLLTSICFCAKCGGAMTLRTGRGSTGRTYRYYTCSTKARQGKTGCKGRTIPMDKPDRLVADHIADRLLQPKRLETVLASVIDRRRNAPGVAVNTSPSFTGESRMSTSGLAASMTPLNRAWSTRVMRWRRNAWPASRHCAIKPRQMRSAHRSPSKVQAIRV